MDKLTAKKRQLVDNILGGNTPFYQDGQALPGILIDYS